MTIEPNSHNLQTPESSGKKELQPDDFDGGTSENNLTLKAQTAQQSFLQSPQNTNALEKDRSDLELYPTNQVTIKPRALLITLIAIALTVIGVALNNWVIGIFGTLITLVLSLAILWPWLQYVVFEWFSSENRTLFVAFLGLLVAMIGLLKFSGLGDRLLTWENKINWDASGAIAGWFGAVGQILVAIIAVFVAWRQYVISKDLTIQQNLLTVQQNIITQQQTIDSYFQNICDIVLDDQGLLEDSPQERIIAQGRTAAIFSSIDGYGKAKILRFLSRCQLLTPLKRDKFDRVMVGQNDDYDQDRFKGVRVIELGIMLAGADLSGTDLRQVDLSEANLIRANLSGCDLVKANLSRTILYDANLSNTDLNGVRLFYGSVEKASPRSRTEPPNYETGESTGAVVENADFNYVQRMSEANRYYCCAWGGEKTRATIPDGCKDIPNQLGR
ncbi:pentapeptide repeat-containing protein [Nostocaceae cyanobacterium CENA357]|uniref:Pentapeptide repeat-containing protein n=1 Tax=Atlanticothrix silvestris CENA357 TaxID=1725252 RepID=A0A8J7HIF3_9CYAN|nr:pentapeptide repeat-containing protein [Atlanticothrix silvestris]MBH8553038.1 pentapeptide repeat-containing protein [Atlanticothrix silvestris CENA357]